VALRHRITPILPFQVNLTETTIYRKYFSSGGVPVARPPHSDLGLEKIEIIAYDRGDIQCHQLRDQKAANHGEAQSAAGFGPGPDFYSNRQSAHQGLHGCHHDQSEKNDVPLANRIHWRHAFSALGLQGEVDHHNRILLDDPDQHDDADKGIEVQVLAKDHQGDQCSEICGRQSGENRQRVNIALIEDAEHDVYDQNRQN